MALFQVTIYRSSFSLGQHHIHWISFLTEQLVNTSLHRQELLFSLVDSLAQLVFLVDLLDLIVIVRFFYDS